MRDVLSDIERWRADGQTVALATVVETWGSAPRPAGGKMAVSSDGKISGSVSGGCVESAVVEAAAKTLSSGEPRLLHFGVSDDTAWSVGLACGGTIDVFIETLSAGLFEPIRDALQNERPVAIATVIRGAEDRLGKKLALFDGGTAAGEIDEAMLAAARTALADGVSQRIPLGESEVFIDVLLPSPRLVIVGGVHIAVALVSLAKTLGFRTIVVDPREAFGNAKRFPHADQIVSEWPDQALSEIGINSSTAVAVLTHDPKLDDPALIRALASPAFYVGALGSRRTQEKRHERLRDAGVSNDTLSRLYAPIGLPLGGRSPEEIALSIMAQVVAARNKK
jgi:xanthine dehydrogenase accessory factor